MNHAIATHRVTEWNFGWERRHGPGGDHVRQPSPANIVNPSRLDSVAANDVRIQFHSQGRLKSNPIQNVYYDWAVGCTPGERLARVWDLDGHKLGETTFTHCADTEAHKNRMQGNDSVQSGMCRRDVACLACHDVQSPNGPRGTIEEHTHHRAGSSGSQCVACHMPRTVPEIANVSVRGHTFRFVTPSMSASCGIPHPCLDCHASENLAWAAAQLAAWRNVSPWRVK